jgi:multiple antibiotic resistance protein
MVMQIFDLFLAVFIPLFVAIDVFGILPIFISWSDNISVSARKRIITEATLTALGISVIFLFAGTVIFNFLGITESDFRIAGGLLLLVLAIKDLALPQPEASRSIESGESTIGIVPLGIPLIMGPAALTTVLISSKSHGNLYTLIALLVNLTIVWWVFQKSDWFLKFLSKSGSKAVAKVMALFLAAIAIMMIRVGVQQILTQMPSLGS